MNNSWKIGNIEIKNKLVLAPIAGVTNAAFIKICEEMGVGYAITELISAEAIVRNNKKTFDMLKGLDKINIPIAVQIFGSNEEVMAKASQILVNDYHVKIIDINAGCPVPKVAQRSNAGSALLKNPEKLGKIIKSITSVVDVPVTVKIRSGWDSKSINAPYVAKICEKSGAKAICIHARTKEQGYSGLANWNIIKEVKESVSIPVIGNGDITTPKKAKEMLDLTKCDAIMIGRASIGNPWLFKETLEYLNSGILISKPTFIEKIEMIKKHYKLLKEIKEKESLLEIRTNALYYMKGMIDSKIYKEKICKAKTEEEFLNILEEYAKKVQSLN